MLVPRTANVLLQFKRLALQNPPREAITENGEWDDSYKERRPRVNGRNSLIPLLLMIPRASVIMCVHDNNMVIRCVAKSWSYVNRLMNKSKIEAIRKRGLYGKLPCGRSPSK